MVLLGCSSISTWSDCSPKRELAVEVTMGLKRFLCALFHPKMGIVFAHRLRLLYGFSEALPARGISAFRCPSFEVIWNCLMANMFL